ncbi:MAG: flagellar type III secretion system pore protein FliP, partial [Pseudomonadota bacterium]
QDSLAALFTSQMDDGGVAMPVRVMLLMTLLSLIPALFIAMTSFIRIIVVLSMLRFAFGMQQTPPNMVLLSLAFLLTVFNTQPALDSAYTNAFLPYTEGELSTQDALEKGSQPFRTFMIAQTREKDLILMTELAEQSSPTQPEEIETMTLIPAFMLSELKTAFQIGFVIFLPFLLIDIVVASVLMSMGMLMVPPMMISLPIKVLMFVLIDGWHLVIESLMLSF